MSHADYLRSQKIDATLPQRASFEALIMAAIRLGHTDQQLRLKAGFPEIFTEYYYRYWSGGGFMPGEEGYDPELDDNIHEAPGIDPVEAWKEQT